jgi:hypothetical protein
MDSAALDPFWQANRENKPQIGLPVYIGLIDIHAVPAEGRNPLLIRYVDTCSIKEEGPSTETILLTIKQGGVARRFESRTPSGTSGKAQLIDVPIRVRSANRSMYLHDNQSTPDSLSYVLVFIPERE